MTNREHKHQNDAMSEAADWYWRIREPDVDESELFAWQEWLAASPDHIHAFDRIEQTLHGIGQIGNVPWPTEEQLVNDRYDGSLPIDEWLRTEGDRGAVPLPQSAEAERSGTHYYGYFALAASVLVAAVLGFLLLSNPASISPLPDVVAYQTAAAEHRDVTLSDGSTIALGGRTRLSVAYSEKSRVVELQSGEAYFDVGKDPKRPFEVFAGGRSIVAVGTAFNVSRQASRVTLTVTEGQVIVRQDGAPSSTGSGTRTGSDGRVAQVNAGQRIVFDQQGIEPITFTDAYDAIAWWNGVLKYRGEKLVYVIEDVNRYTPLPIRVADDAAGELLFTGTVFQDSAESWVYGLEDAFPVTVERSAAGVTIYSRQQ